MKFSTRKAVKTATKKNQYLDIKTYFKKYIQSYLRWIYEQNSDFEENIKTEELTDFFINELAHPLWFQLYLKSAAFRVMVEVNNYIQKYKKYANRMEVAIPIILIEPISNLTPVTIDITYKPAEGSEKQTAEYLSGHYKLRMPEVITEVDAILLNQVNNLRKGVNQNAK